MGSRNRFDKSRRVAPVELQAPMQTRSRAENRRSSSNPVRPSQPAGEPTVYSQTAGTSYYETPDGRSVYKSGDNVYDMATGQKVMQIGDETGIYDGPHSQKENGNGDAYVGTNVRNMDGQVIKEGEQIWKVPDSTLNTGGGGGNRDNSRVIPGSGGAVQKGTDMGRSFNDLLATTNTSGYQPYSSNQLPGTSSNPFSGTAPKTQSFETGRESQTGNSLTNFGGDGSAAFAQSRERTGNDTFNPSAARVEGGSDRAKAGSLDAALADKDGINSYMSKFSDGDRQRAANRAFLDTEGSMAGLRAKEAVNGVVYAGGQHRIAGENADSAAIGIDRTQARDISNGKSTAQGILEAHIKKNKPNATGTPAESQDPAVSFEQGSNSGLNVADSSGMNLTQGDFKLNNDVGTPFGKTGGYKSQSTYKDPSFPNPFG